MPIYMPKYPPQQVRVCFWASVSLTIKIFRLELPFNWDILYLNLGWERWSIYSLFFVTHASIPSFPWSWEQPNLILDWIRLKGLSFHWIKIFFSLQICHQSEKRATLAREQSIPPWSSAASGRGEGLDIEGESEEVIIEERNDSGCTEDLEWNFGLWPLCSAVLWPISTSAISRFSTNFHLVPIAEYPILVTTPKRSMKIVVPGEAR